MSKKAHPDPKTRSIQHVNGTKKDSKAMVNARNKEVVDVEWVKSPINSFTMRFEEETSQNAYQLFTELDKSDKGGE